MGATYSTIEEVLQENVNRMLDQVTRFPWDDKDAYGYLLAQTYYYTRHTTRILALAGSYFDHSMELLHKRFLKHADEENGHENLALSDLRNLGMRIEEMPEFEATRNLYQSQYYWIQNVHPVAIYGYILSLEAFAVHKCQEMNEICRKNYGPKASSFWRIHADEDPDHLDKAVEQVSELPTRFHDVIIQNLVQTTKNYQSIYDSILRVVDDKCMLSHYPKSISANGLEGSPRN